MLRLAVVLHTCPALAPAQTTPWLQRYYMQRRGTYVACIRICMKVRGARACQALLVYQSMRMCVYLCGQREGRG